MKRVAILLLSTMGLFGCLQKKSPEEKFWIWFSDYSQKIGSIEDLSDPRLTELLDPLSMRLHDYCDGLVFEIGYQKETKLFELVVSADGDKTLFSKVETLVKAAPLVKQWEITALKQPKGSSYTINYEGYNFNSDHILFIPTAPTENTLPISIDVVYADYEEEQHNLFLGGTFLLLDALLGEKSTELDLAHISVSRQPNKIEEDECYPLSRLKSYIDSKKKPFD